MRAAERERKIVTAPNHLRIGTFCEKYGGVFAAFMRGWNGAPDYYLFVPPGPEAEIAATWGGYGADEPGAVSDHDGFANTIALCDSKTDHPAAKFCRGFKAYGLDDYHLAARNEQRVIQINCPEVFTKKAHWTSTQSSPYYAWFQGSDGNQYVYYKDYEYLARPVRRLIIQ